MFPVGGNEEGKGASIFDFSDMKVTVHKDQNPLHEQSEKSCMCF